MINGYLVKIFCNSEKCSVRSNGDFSRSWQFCNCRYRLSWIFESSYSKQQGMSNYGIELARCDVRWHGSQLASDNLVSLFSFQPCTIDKPKCHLKRVPNFDEQSLLIGMSIHSFIHGFVSCILFLLYGQCQKAYRIITDLVKEDWKIYLSRLDSMPLHCIWYYFGFARSALAIWMKLIKSSLHLFSVCIRVVVSALSHPNWWKLPGWTRVNNRLQWWIDWILINMICIYIYLCIQVL